MAKVLRDTLVIQSRPGRIADARQWAAQQTRAAGFGEDAVFAVELALGEALANVVEHAYDGDEAQEIRLTLVVDGEKLCLTIRDYGRKFDQASYTPPDLDVPAEGGYGVYLMHELMDEVTYDSSPPEGTRLSLVKYRSGEVHG
ncbi:MAG: ATP-binding protein [Anaerolineae bacterium]